MEAEGIRQDLGSVHTHGELLAQLDLLRRRGAKGMRKARLSLDDIAKRSGIPRSTVHAYVSGKVMPPPDALDAMVIAMGSTPEEQRDWGDALFRIPSGDTAAAASAPALSPVTSVPRQLPARLRGFTGRAIELRAIEDAYRGFRGTAPLIALVGTGGLGKTSLAVEWAYGHLDEFPDGQIHVDLRGFGPNAPLDPSRVMTRFLLALGYAGSELPADAGVLADLYRTALAGRRLLVLLDNARDAAQVRPLLPGSPTVTVLVTSRDDLRSLAVREGAARVTLGPLLTNEGRMLLTELSGLGLSGEQLDLLVERCDGLPLALRIIAERIADANELPDVMAELDSAESMLDAMSVIDRGQDTGIRGVLGWSYASVTPAGQELFRNLAVVPGPRISVGAAAALRHVDQVAALRHVDQVAALRHVDRVAALRQVDQRAVKRELDELVSVHLFATDSGAYLRHDLVTAFAMETLEASQSEEYITAIRKRVFTHYLKLADAAVNAPELAVGADLALPEGLGAAYALSGITEAEEIMAAEEDTMVAIVHEASTHHDPQVAWLLAERLFNYADRFGRSAGSLAMLEVALRCAQLAGNRHAEGVMHNRMGKIHRLLADHTLAIRHYRAAIDRGYETGQDDLVSGTLSALGIVLALTGDFDDARAAHEEALALARRSGRPQRIAMGTMNLGALHSERGEFDTACEYFEQSAELYGSVGDEGSRMLALVNWAADAARMSEFAKANELVREILVLHKWLGNSLYDGPVLWTIAEVALLQGNYERAEDYNRQVMSIARTTEDALLTVRSRIQQGTLMIARGDLQAARQILNSARELADEVGYAGDSITASLELARTLVLMGERSEAGALIEQALIDSERLRLRWQTAMAEELRSEIKVG